MSFQALRPKMVNFKSFEEAAHAVDEIFNLKEGATGMALLEDILGILRIISP